MTDTILIGVDGGGTGCRARIRSLAGEALGEGAGGPANIRLGIELAWANVLGAIDEALACAGLDRATLSTSAIALGLAGIVDEAGGHAFLAAGPRFAAARAVSDGHTACVGAFSGRDGAILISGTGSAGFAVVGGRETPMFGWGFEIGDRGSAASLGRRALHMAVDAVDGLVPATDFTRRAFGAVGGTRAALVDWVTRASPRDYGSLAPLVMSSAMAGDPLALSLVRETAGDIEVMMARLNALGAPKICLMGGMAPHTVAWLSPWARSLLVERESDATEGALLLARTEMETRP